MMSLVRLLFVLIASSAFYISGSGYAFSIDKYLIKNGDKIGISLNGFEAAVVNKPTDIPYLFVGQASGKCYRVPGFRNWICDNPNANASGLQDVVLKTGPAGVEIGREKVYLLDQEVSILALSKLDGKIFKGGIEYKDGGIDSWVKRVSFPGAEFVKQLQIRNNDSDFRSSLTYIPTTFDKAIEYSSYDKIDDFPAVCQNGMTYIGTTAESIRDLLSGDIAYTGFIAVSPTKEPIVGEFAYSNSYNDRIVPASVGKDLNASILKSIGIPEKINRNVIEYYQKQANNSGRRQDQVKNYNSTTIFVLDTYDGTRDAFGYRGVEGHGSVINNIIYSIDRQANIHSINVCRNPYGNCDERLIIDGICQAILFNAKYSDPSGVAYTKVIVNLSISSDSASSHLKELINFARKKQIIFVVANGNIDTCANYTMGTTCHQYPADWSKDTRHNSYAPMITVGGIDYLKRESLSGSLSTFDRTSTLNSIKTADIYAPSEYYQTIGGISRSQSIRRTGTSFAAPYVTGIISLWLRIFGGPDFIPCEMGSVIPSVGIIALHFPDGNLDGFGDGAEYGGSKFDYECID